MTATRAPTPAVYTKEMAERCMEEIYLPTIRGMEAEGRPFKGILYFSLMLTENGPKVIEYNARFGDPETQVVLPLLTSDLLNIMVGIRAVDGSVLREGIPIGEIRTVRGRERLVGIFKPTDEIERKVGERGVGQAQIHRDAGGFREFRIRTGFRLRVILHHEELVARRVGDGVRVSPYASINVKYHTQNDRRGKHYRRIY